MQIQKKIDNLCYRLKTLKDNNNKIVLECINDYDNNKYYHLIKVLDIFNNVIDTSDAIDIPKESINKYIKKYNCKINLEFFDINNGIKTPHIALINNYKYN